MPALLILLLLAPLPQPVDIIVGNLPYVRDDEVDGLSREIRDYEPRVALSGGADGLDVIRRLIAEAPSKLLCGGAVFLEIAPLQAEALVSWAEDLDKWDGIEPVKDCAGVTRGVRLVLTKRGS